MKEGASFPRGRESNLWNIFKSKEKAVFFTLTAVILFLGIFFRVYNIGYSEFQGDEVEAQAFLFEKKPFVDFLMERSKGPGQYAVTYLTHTFIDNLEKIEIYVRLPFLITSILGLLFFLALAKKIHGQNGVLISTLLFSFSGMLIAFSKIAQYQTFVILFSIISYYLLNSYINNKKTALPLILGFISGLSLLFHYDSLSFVLPLFLFFLLTKDKKATVLYLTSFFLLTLTFYVPFIFSPNFAKTFNYLFFKRIETKEFSTLLLLTIYHSKEYLVFLILIVMGFVYKFCTKNSKFLSILILLVFISVFIRNFLSLKIFSAIYVLCVLISLLFLFLYILHKRKGEFNTYDSVDIWFLFSFIFYTLIIKLPLTHVYVFLTPLFLVAGKALETKNKPLNYFIMLFFVVVIVSSVSFNFSAFVDTYKEYPWNKKSYVFGSMFTDISEKKQVKGVFGFPYNRRWKEIREFIKENNVVSYNTNEKVDISNFYINYKNLSPVLYVQQDSDLYIFIKKPQSLVNTLKVKGSPILELEKASIYRKGYYKLGF